jgi:hypothetical protein
MPAADLARELRRAGLNSARQAPHRKRSVKSPRPTVRNAPYCFTQDVARWLK